MMNISHNQQPFTWFVLVNTLDETIRMIHGYYQKLLSMHTKANESGNTSSPLHGWDMKQEYITVYVTLEVDELSIALCPSSDQGIDTDHLYYELGGGSYLASLNDIGGRPSYAECMKVITYLLRPIQEKVGHIDVTDIENYCRGGKGYIVLTQEDARFMPLTTNMHEIGLATPDDFLERMGYFGPR